MPIKSHAYASTQLCSSYGGWIPAGAYAQMRIPTFYPTVGPGCVLSISPNKSYYNVSDQFSVTLTSSRSLGHKLVAIGGGNFTKQSSGGKLSTTSCVDWNNQYTTSSAILLAPSQGGQIFLRALCGTNENVMYVSNDITLQAGADVQPPVAATSTDPNYQFETNLGTGFNLFYKANATHLNVKVELQRQGYVSIGIGSAMIGSIVLVGMDPASNAGYSSVGIYSLVSKSGTNAQIANLLAGPSQFSQYGIVSAAFTSSSSLSTLTFVMAISSQNSQLTFINTAAGGVNCVYAAGSAVAFGQHSICGSLLMLNMATGASNGNTNSGSTGAGITPPITPGTTGGSSDPGYNFQINLNGQLSLFYALNTTHLKIRMQYKTQGWIGLGVGLQMIGGITVLGINPITNAGYPAVSVAKLTSKTGSNAQISSQLAGTSPTLLSQYGVTASSFTSSAAESNLYFAIELDKQDPSMTFVPVGGGSVSVIFGAGLDGYGMHNYQGLATLNFQANNTAGFSLIYIVSEGLAGHIIGCILAWQLLAPSGVVVAGFGRHGIFFTQWFRSHWVIMTLGVFTFYIAAALGYQHVDAEGSTHWATDHKKLGLAMILLSIVQPLVGHFRPSKLTQQERATAPQYRLYARTAARTLHTWLGYLLFVSGFAASLLGVQELANVAGGNNVNYEILGYSDFTGFNGSVGRVIIGLAVFFLCLVFLGGLIIGIYEYDRNASINGKRVDDGSVNTTLANLPRFTRAQVSKHSFDSDCWVVYVSGVYDVTKFAPSHPGGKRRIIDLAGQDITEAFDDVGHTSAALATLTRCLVGRLVDEEAAPDLKQQQQLVPAMPGRKHIFLAGDQQRKGVELAGKVTLSHNVVRLRFKMLDVDPNTVLGLPIGKHIVVYGPQPLASRRGFWNGKKDPESSKKEIQRKYTPISDPSIRGYFELVVKVYRPNPATFPDGGKMSTFIGDRLRVGDVLEISGKGVGSHEYLGNDVFRGEGGSRVTPKQVCMVAGGSGITPIYQVGSALLRDQGSICAIKILYANSSVDDVLLKEELDDMQRKAPQRVKVWYTVSTPPPAVLGKPWKYSTGRISKPMLVEYLGLQNADVIKDWLFIVCGPPPMNQTVFNILGELGVSKDKIYEM